MSWSLSIAATPQGKVRDALEEARTEAARAYTDGFAKDVTAQQDAVFDAVDLLVAKGEFHGQRVAVSIVGHAAQGEDESDSVSLVVTGEAVGR